MSRYDGLIIPRSYSEYINKTDAATLQQALQLPGVLSGAVAAGDNKAVKSKAIIDYLQGNAQKTINGGLSVDSLTVGGSRPLFNQDIKNVMIDLNNGNEVTFEKDNLYNTGLYVARFTYDFGEYIDLNQYRMIGYPSLVVPYTNSNVPNLYLVTNAFIAKNLTGAYIYAINNISARAWLTATFVRA